MFGPQIAKHSMSGQKFFTPQELHQIAGEKFLPEPERSNLDDQLFIHFPVDPPPGIGYNDCNGSSSHSGAPGPLLNLRSGPPKFMSEQTADINLDELEVRDRLLTTSVTKAQLLRLAMKGLNATEASKIVGCSPETARSHYANPDFRRAVLAKVEGAFEGIDKAFEERRKGLHEMLEEQALRSCEELIGMVANPELHPSLKVKIHQDFLNRVEDSAPQAKHSYKMDATDLRHAAKVAAEMDNVIPFKKKETA